MAAQLRDVARAAQIPLGAVLEGGYEPEALGECVRATLDALAGEGRAQSGAPMTQAAARAAAQVSRYWPL
jgi:acetoin utilization deacetylase AcuC-like enzyme